MEKEKLQYDASITGWLKQKGKDIQDWFTSPKTRKAVINAGLILCHDENWGETGQQLYQEAIREKDPEVLEKQRMILATPGLSSAFSIPGAQWITAALSAMELPQAIKKGYNAYQNHHYYELYDQMLNGMFSTLGMIPAAAESAKMISKFNKNDQLINYGQLIHDFGFYEPVDGAIKANDAVGKANYLRALQDAKDYMSSPEVVEAAGRANRVAKRLYDKDPIKYPFKGTNIQTGPNNVEASIETTTGARFRGKSTGVGNNKTKITVNEDYLPQQQETTVFHEGLHTYGMGSETSASANQTRSLGPTSIFNNWRAEKILKSVDEIDDPKLLAKRTYLTTIYDQGNEFQVLFATAGKALGLKPDSKYIGPEQLKKLINIYREMEPEKAKIFDVLKTDKDGNILYPGYVWKLMTGNFKFGGKIQKCKELLRKLNNI